ncbi:MAG: ParA family protein [Anaerolineales bacterium]
MKIIAVANYKGGVGKTTTTHALGEALAERDRRVLLVDTDPQASLTAILCGGVPRDTNGEPLREVAPGLALLTLSTDTLMAQSGPLAGTGRDNVLSRALDAVRSEYDVALVDCPPLAGLPMWIILATAHAALIPTQAQAVDLHALRSFLEALEQVRADSNPGLTTLGILITFYDARLRHHRAIATRLQESGLPVLPVVFGRSVRVAEAAAHGQAIVRYAPGHPQAHAYRYLGAHVDGWLAS